MATTGEIKIKELDAISSEQVQDTNLMVIETSSDTKSITINDLKIIFSADQKITAVQMALLNAIEQQRVELDEIINAILDTIELNETQLKELSDYINQNKQQVLTIQKNILDLQNLTKEHSETLESINKLLDEHGNLLNTHSNEILDLQKLTEEHSKEISTAKQNIQTNTDDIKSLTQSYTEYTNTNNLNIAELKKADTTNSKDLKQYVDNSYDDIMQYIDYYHHYTENPPNFDEPYYYEKELAGYVYPIGSLYHTTISTWDPKNYKVPGTWILVGTVTLSGDDNIIEYVYERIE